MKAILEFDLTERSEQLDLNCCVRGKEMMFVLKDVIKYKYKELSSDERLSDEYLAGAKEVIDSVIDSMHTYGINLDELTE